MADLMARATAVNKQNREMARPWFDREEKICQRLGMEVSQVMRQKEPLSVKDIDLLCTRVNYLETLASQRYLKFIDKNVVSK